MIRKLVFILFFASCVSVGHDSEMDLIGKWKGRFNESTLNITFTTDTFFYFYNDKEAHINYKCKYYIKDDSLYLNKKDNIERHILSKMKKDMISFTSAYGASKDVQLLDGLDFRRIE